MKNQSHILLGAAILFGALLPLHSQQDSISPETNSELSAEESAELEKHDAFISSLSWQTEGTATLGSRGTLHIPDGYRFTGSPDTSTLMEYYGNLTDGKELGFISPQDMDWFAVFEFEEIGYVKDDDKDKLNADEILKQMQEGQKEANKELTRRGLSTMDVVGWHTPPFYNPTTNNLEWALRLYSHQGGEILNYKTKILGRRGVMDVVLVCSEEQLATIIPEYQNILQGFEYKTEENYAAFTQGDKVAEYGLIGLIAGGGLLVAAKSGLLAKLWKPIAIGVVAVGAFIKRILVGKTATSV